MLRERKELVEQEIQKLYKLASALYLRIVTTGGDVHSKEYQDMKDKISALEYDLSLINQLIKDGHN